MHHLLSSSLYPVRKYTIVLRMLKMVSASKFRKHFVHFSCCHSGHFHSMECRTNRWLLWPCKCFDCCFCALHFAIHWFGVDGFTMVCSIDPFVGIDNIGVGRCDVGVVHATFGATSSHRIWTSCSRHLYTLHRKCHRKIDSTNLWTWFQVCTLIHPLLFSIKISIDCISGIYCSAIWPL